MGAFQRSQSFYIGEIKAIKSENTSSKLLWKSTISGTEISLTRSECGDGAPEFQPYFHLEQTQSEVHDIHMHNVSMEFRASL